MRRPIPEHAPMTDANGRVTLDWLLWFQSVMLSNLTDVSTTAPTNGQVLIFNSTTKLWTPGTN